MQPVALLKVEMDEKLERRGGWLFDSFSMEGTQGTNDVEWEREHFCAPLIVGREEHVKAWRRGNVDDWWSTKAISAISCGGLLIYQDAE